MSRKWEGRARSRRTGSPEENQAPKVFSQQDIDKLAGFLTEIVTLCSPSTTLEKAQELHWGFAEALTTYFSETNAAHEAVRAESER